MRNLARATATAGLAVAFGFIALPTASAATHDAASATKAKSSAPAKTSASAKKAAAQKAAVKKAVARALAANRPITVNVYYVMHDGRVISEQGPGDNAAHEVQASGPVDMRGQNESIRTGDLEAEVDGKAVNSPVTFEVEGSEQDQGEAS